MPSFPKKNKNSKRSQNKRQFAREKKAALFVCN